MKKMIFVFLMVCGIANQAMAQDKVTIAQIGELVQFSESGKVTQADVGIFLGKFRQPAPVALTDITYRVEIECDPKAALAAGKYDFQNDIILEKHPPRIGLPQFLSWLGKGGFDFRLDLSSGFYEADCKSGQAEIVLVNFGREMSDPEALCGLEKRGLRPATLPELLALGATMPKLQRQFYIAALGSVWRNPVGVSLPILCESGGNRGICLGWDVPGHKRDDANIRFAAVRKVSK